MKSRRVNISGMLGMNVARSEFAENQEAKLLY